MTSVERNYDHLLKIVIVGDTAGKSSLMKRFVGESFSYFEPSNFCGGDFKIRTVEINGERLKLQLWDTAGHERYRLVTNSYCRGAHGVILVYDITNVGTFTNLRW